MISPLVEFREAHPPRWFVRSPPTRSQEGGGHHATEVEPDSYAFGSTVVAVFQVGRIRTGGATVIAIAVSRNGGSSWKSGLLPGLTKLSPQPGADDCQIQSSPPRSSPDGPCSCSHSLADQWRGCFDTRS